MPGPSKPESGSVADCVVLLHGVGMSAAIMSRLERHLMHAGYRVANISYPSRTMPIEQIAGEFLPAQLREHRAADARRLHFVTHSMGGLVLRLFLADPALRPANLGRVVMLGPPNHGSAAADTAWKNAFLRNLAGVNIARLGTGPEAVTRCLGPADFDVGVIAGDAKINPFFARELGAPNDGAVTLESARLEGMHDFIVMGHSHTVMLWRGAVIRQVLAYLRDGRFEHGPQ
ncbi:hypothetical protein OH491_20570 [Termitidicoccus mucosus]|uniref:AB hydrolase-1 domain-containing protein n=1 Tax=Termitidicoccus mucosus TaxID=1184151 RepID=A0A178IBV0_9BACT|nr:hypothetical protein AW736_23135 [Opitutaceae bacterium TSB47]